MEVTTNNNNNANDAPPGRQSQSQTIMEPSPLTTNKNESSSHIDVAGVAATIPQQEEEEEGNNISGVSTTATTAKDNGNGQQQSTKTSASRQQELSHHSISSYPPLPRGCSGRKGPLPLPPPGSTPPRNQKRTNQSHSILVTNERNNGTSAFPTIPNVKATTTAAIPVLAASAQVIGRQSQQQQQQRAATSANTPATPTTSNPTKSTVAVAATIPTSAQQQQQQVLATAYNQDQIDEYIQQSWDGVSATISTHIAQPVHNFFYPSNNRASPTNSDVNGSQSSTATGPMEFTLSPPPPPPNQSPSASNNNNNNPSWYSNNSSTNRAAAARRHQVMLERQQQMEDDRKWMEKFWKTYDDIVILSIFGQLGIVFRLAAANWFAFFDDTFSPDSALFTNLPLNCLSCFLMGFLGSGNDVIEIVNTRKTLTAATTMRPSPPPPLSSAAGAAVVDHESVSVPASPEFRVKSPLSPNSIGSPTSRQLAAAEVAVASQLLNGGANNDQMQKGDDIEEQPEGNQASSAAATAALSKVPTTPSPMTEVKPSSVASLRRRTRQQIEEEYEQEHHNHDHHHLHPYRQKGRFASKYDVWRTKNKVKRAAAEAAQSAEDELREVQLQALERRIRASPCLVLFPGKKEAMDVMEHYSNFEDAPHNYQTTTTTTTKRRSQISPTSSSSPTNNTGRGRKSYTNHQQQHQEPQSSLFDLEFQEEQEEDNQMGNSGGDGDAGITADNSSAMSTPPPTKSKMKHLQTLSSISEQQQQQHLSDDENVMNDFVQQSTRSVPNGMTMEEGQHTTATVVIPPGQPSRRILTPPPNDGQRLRNPQGEGLDHFVHDVTSTIGTNLSRIQRINIADGWDVGTTPEAMSDDLLLGLRIGFCGALSSFTSWNSSMVNLLRNGQIGEAIVGYLIGLQLPIVAYRFGQHAAVYHFVWRCRREAKRDDRRGGYGIRIRGSEDDDDDYYFDDDNDDSDERNSNHNATSGSNHGIAAEQYPRRLASSLEDGANSDYDAQSESSGSIHTNTSSPTLSIRRKRQQKQRTRNRQRQRNRVINEVATDRDLPSVRAVATAIFMMALITEVTSIFFFNEAGQQQVAISLLFSPFGVLARWRLVKFNYWRPGFPLGTFACNILACALSGSLGRLLAGNPGPEESIVVLAMISGFGGSLSSLAAFVREILSGLDPIIFKWDGVTYAVATLFWGFLIGFLTRASNDWADDTTTTAVAAITNTTGTVTTPFGDDDDNNGGGLRFLFL